MDDNRLPELCGQLELAFEELALPFVRRVVAVEVEAGLADRDGALVAEQLAQLVEPGRLGISRLMRVDSEGRENPLVARGDGEALAAGVEP